MTSEPDFMELFRVELESLDKPHANVNERGVEAQRLVLLDIHRALYGNGGTHGVLWKLAEHGVLLKVMKEREDACRARVDAHLSQAGQTVIQDVGSVVSLFRRHPKLFIWLGILTLVGLNSLMMAMFQARQTIQFEQVVLDHIVQRRAGQPIIGSTGGPHTPAGNRATP
jgi:hypothetical protein